MILVKKVNTESIPQIQELAEITWAVAYAAILPPAQMTYMLGLFYSTEALRNQMEDGHQFILAMENDDTLGFASYSPKAVDAGNIADAATDATKNIYRLHKIYIDPAQQGRGIGKLLLDFIIADIKPLGATDLELNVNRFNKALEFYRKTGFVISREEDIDIGNGYFMNDYVMNLPLSVV